MSGKVFDDQPLIITIKEMERGELIFYQHLCNHISMTRLLRISLMVLFTYVSIIECNAQLTVFNVSSSDITDARKISVQQQFEADDEIESSTTMTYGLGGKWEAGSQSDQFGLQY
jgi:hypothetical protein